MSQEFEYEVAFSRNLGLLTSEEQQKLRTFTIAIPGMGGVGGAHLISLVRQGFEHFKIADRDSFEMKNMNRQFGARPDTIGREKIEVMREEALRINPNCTFELFKEGVTETNITEFLKGVDIVVDSIELFEVDVHRLMYNAALSQNIPVVFAAPIGFGSAFYTFMPGGPTFDEYFAFSSDMTYWDKMLHFLMGLLPSMLQRKYMDQSNVNLKEKRGPSSIGAVNLCVGIVTITVLKILLKKGIVKSVPYYHQFDVMRNTYVVKRLWFGNHNPIQRIKMVVARRKYF